MRSFSWLNETNCRQGVVSCYRRGAERVAEAFIFQQKSTLRCPRRRCFSEATTLSRTGRSGRNRTTNRIRVARKIAAARRSSTTTCRNSALNFHYLRTTFADSFADSSSCSATSSTPICHVVHLPSWAADGSPKTCDTSRYADAGPRHMRSGDWNTLGATTFLVKGRRSVSRHRRRARSRCSMAAQNLKDA